MGSLRIIIDKGCLCHECLYDAHCCNTDEELSDNVVRVTIAICTTEKELNDNTMILTIAIRTKN